MSELSSLVKRNVMVFCRTKSNIFFSILAIAILVVLHFLILREMYTDQWSDLVSNMGIVVERTDLYWMVDSLMFAAIIVVGAISISLVTLTIIVADKETNALSDFLVSPIKRNSLFISYLISSFLIGFVILMGFVIFFEIYFIIVFGISFTLLQIVLIVISSIGVLIFSNVFMLLVMSLIKSQQSVGSIGTVLGTMIGFITGAYIPMGMFGSFISDILSSLPFYQLTALVREIFYFK